VHFPIKDGAFTPEAIAAQWDKINNFEKNSQYPQGLNDSMGVMIAHLGKAPSNVGLGKPQVSARAAAFVDKPVKSPEPVPQAGIDVNFVEDWSKNVTNLLVQTDSSLKKAVSQQEDLQSKLKIVLADAGGKSSDVDKLRADAEHLKKQCGVLKKFLDDATTEKEIMYDAFNEELDGMFNDVSLPENEAWQAMVQDLRKAKDARNQLSIQNTKLKQELEETKLQSEHYETLLRKAGLL